MLRYSDIPRVVIAGLGGDSGKTLLTIGLIANLKDLFNIAIFKKGPDYIDPSWLTLAGNRTTYNLDTFLMGKRKVLESFISNTKNSNLSIIEGNRGLYDGFDEKGSHSTAELAKLLKAPVILIINASKVTRTAAAIAYGCKFFDKKVEIKGIILNNVYGKRHFNIISKTILQYTGIPVIGFIPKIAEKDILPSRHLGLVTPDEIEYAKKSVNQIKNIIKENVDIESVIQIAKKSKIIKANIKEKNIKKPIKVRIGIFKDKSFSFYYPENIEFLSNEGAEIVELSSFKDNNLKDVDGLYIGGGFPETHIHELSNNKELLYNVKAKAEDGMPIYAECGGLIYLAKELEVDNKLYNLSNILPIKIKMNKIPQGHGYAISKVDKRNNFFKINSILKAHEFHYTNIENIYDNESFDTCMEMIKGEGAYQKREGIIYKNVFGTYLHIHSQGVPLWAKSFVKVAFNYKNRK